MKPLIQDKSIYFIPTHIKIIGKNKTVIIKAPIKLEGLEAFLFNTPESLVFIF